MHGRKPCSDDEAMLRGFYDDDCARRREVLRETIAALESPAARDRYHRLARQNLDRWRSQAIGQQEAPHVEVCPGDWGVVAHGMTVRYGECFAVLNMANAHVPGGAYIEGAPAQEENMFRRTDCHFRIDENEYDRDCDRYRPALTRLISGQDGNVYLDVQRPRVCIRGHEDRSRADLGYEWHADDQVFPFFELCAAAQDLRGGKTFDPEEGRRRIVAQLDTLRSHGVRHVVLGAFGCGAFENPAAIVAAMYREEIQRRAADFDVVAFAIRSAGYGPDNYSIFAGVFG